MSLHHQPAHAPCHKRKHTKRKRNKYYAVRAGRTVGVFPTWAECQAQVCGFSGAEFKRFGEEAEAWSWIHEASTPVAGTIQHTDPSGDTKSAEPHTKRRKIDCSNGEVASDSHAHSRSRWSEWRPLVKCETPVFCASDIDSTPRLPWTLHFDGACKGNPGPGAGGGVLVCHRGCCKVRYTKRLMSERATNNQAEYTGLIEGLRLARFLGATVLQVYGDSKLVVQQMAGAWRVKQHELKLLHRQACTAILPMAPTSPVPMVKHVYREANSTADACANAGLERVTCQVYLSVWQDLV